MFEEDMALGIREPMKRVNHVPTPKELENKKRNSWDTWSKYDYIPSGNLVLEAAVGGYGSANASVRDTKNKKLDPRLNEFLVRMAKAAYRQHQRNLQRQEEERLREIERRRREEIRCQFEGTARQRQLLLDESGRFAKAADLRAYISTIQNKANADAQNADVSRWVKWARTVADRLDPTVNGYTEVEFKPRYSWQ